MHLPALIHDLAIILMTAGIVSLAFKWLKQPVVLGYLVAGFLVGPHFSIFPTVTDSASISIWGEIGVLFVLFALGLEFSFRRLLTIGGPAAVTALVETSLMFGLGTFSAAIMGWRHLDAWFWGGMMCISSTTIILKIFDEKGLKSRSFAQLVTGILIVEDLVAVLLLVLLSTVAVRRQFSGTEMAWAGLRLSFFLTLWFVIGLSVLPRLLKTLRKLLNEETTLIFAVGLCLLMVLIASESGFSPALGAFVMGSLLAETTEGGRIEKLLHPLRDFFAAVFFVSVGMLFNPETFAGQWPWVLFMAAVLVVGKTMAVSFGAILSGQSLSTSVKAGLSLTQIGEFSFIIAALGTKLGVISEEHYPMAVAVSLLTSFTTPYCVSAGPWLVKRVDSALPVRWREALVRYQGRVQQEGSDRNSLIRLRSYFFLISINLVLIFAVSWIMRHVFYTWVISWWGDDLLTRMFGFGLAFSVAAPFFYGLCWRRPPSARLEGPIVQKITQVARLIVGLVVSLFIAGQYVSWAALSGFAVAAVLVFGALIYRYGGRAYRGLESRLLDQISGRAEAEPATAPALVPWDHHISEFVIDPDSPLVGRSLSEIGAQETFGVVIAAVNRGRRRIVAPKAGDVLYPGDRLQILGSDEGLARFQRLTNPDADEPSEPRNLQLENIVIPAHSPLVGLLLRDSGLREKVDGLLVGLERAGVRQLNPPADLRLEAGDRLWIVGDPDKIRSLEGDAIS